MLESEGNERATEGASKERIAWPVPKAQRVGVAEVRRELFRQRLANSGYFVYSRSSRLPGPPRLPLRPWDMIPTCHASNRAAPGTDSIHTIPGRDEEGRTPSTPMTSQAPLKGPLCNDVPVNTGTTG